MIIGKRIKERRKELGMSADDLARQLGKDRSTIYRYEKGDIENMPLDILEPIAKVLNTTPQFLMGWDQIQKQNDQLVELIVRLRRDESFAGIVKKLDKLQPEQLDSVNQLLSAFVKE